MASQKTGMYANRVTAPEPLLARLDEARSLTDGWDSYGAKAPTAPAIRRAAVIIGDFASGLLAAGCHAEVSPSLDGGILLAFEHGERSLDILVENGGSLSVDRDDEHIANVTLASLTEHVRWLKSP